MKGQSVLLSISFGCHTVTVKADDDNRGFVTKPCCIVVLKPIKRKDADVPEWLIDDRQLGSIGQHITDSTSYLLYYNTLLS